jgi:NAD(P)-dependent dehydrogenase (short-subunit alcohol dehydrogenase family)
MATFELAGTLGVLQEMARRLAPLGITLNVVTLMTSSVVPTPRKATSSEVAALVEMLCDDQAGFITAQSFSMVIGLG